MASRTGLLPASVNKGRDIAGNTDRKLARRSVAPVKSLVKELAKPAVTSKHERRSTPGRFAPTTPDARRSQQVKVMSARRSEGKRSPLGHSQKPKSTPGPQDKGRQTSQAPRLTPRQRQIVTPGKKSPTRSILKKSTSEKRPAPGESSAARHVTFKSKVTAKVTAQASMRSKLNDYLTSKGKTPSRCRHLMCFDEKMSAKKKETKLVDRQISSNLLEGQDKAIEKEVRKNLFHSPGSHTEVKVGSPTKVKVTGATGDHKENTEPPADLDETFEIVVPDYIQQEIEAEEKVIALSKALTPSANMEATSRAPQPNMEATPQPPKAPGPDLEAIHNNLNSMLEECLNLFKGGCPLENIIPWLDKMADNIPQARGFAPYWLTKAKVVESWPGQVLEVMCEAVRWNAQPSSLLAQEMQTLLSPHLVSGAPNPNLALNELPNPNPVLARATPYLPLTSPITPHLPLPHLPTPHLTSPHTVIPHVPSHTSSPVEDSSTSTPSSQTTMGSVIRYSIYSTAPLLSKTPSAAPLAVVTPVRRSGRLSHRRSTPGPGREVTTPGATPGRTTPGLTREVNSVSDLSEADRNMMLFKVNPAVTGE